MDAGTAAEALMNATGNVDDIESAAEKSSVAAEAGDDERTLDSIGLAQRK